MTDDHFEAELQRRLATPEGRAAIERQLEPVYLCPEGCGARISRTYHERGYRCDGCADNAESQGMMRERGP